MPERENRRDKILDAASALFMERGYQASSVRQIAEAVGCTEAALYYHFKGGKRELLQAVIGMAEVDLRSSVELLEDAVSLRDLIERYGRERDAMRGGRVQKTIRWIASEMRHLNTEEREAFYRPLLEFHRTVRDIAGRYVDEGAADTLAWLLICTGFGFRQIFFDMELETRLDIDIQNLYSLLAENLGAS
jgi:AcrR family transcriptional regulator